MERTVDLPAPFGPSSVVIVPARAVSDTLLNARRRPYDRLTSTRRSSVKSSATPLLDLGVKTFELGHQIGAARSVNRRVDRTLPPARLERRKLGEELVALAVQLAAAC